ncbi:MAG: glycosyltransferase [Woeseia sp.]|nr:glycosyltransferase [Woeseia sp.]
MKIVVTSSSFPTTDSDHVPRFVLEQVQELAKLDSQLDIYVLVPHHAYAPAMPDRTETDSHTEIRYHYAWPRTLEKLAGRGILPALREQPLRYLLIPFFLAAQRRALARLVRELQPDLIYAHWFMPQGLIASNISHAYAVPYMFTTHAADVSVLRRLPFSRQLVARALRRAACFTAVSERTASKLRDMFDDVEWNSQFASKLSIIPMGTSLAMPDLPADDVRKLLTAFGIGGDQNYILGLGRLSEKKGFDYLIDAYSELSPERRQKYQLVVAGDGQSAAALKERASARGVADTTVFTGYVNGELKQALLQNAVTFVLPSIIDQSGDSEGMPVVLMEALAAGKWVVASDVSGAEEILHDECGILVPQRSSEALAAAIEDLLNCDEETMLARSRAARELADQFAWESIARRHLQLIKLAGRSGLS